MIKFILFSTLVCLAAARAAPRTSGNPKDIAIVRSEVENNGDGTYSYRYELTDGTIVEQRGYLKTGPGSKEPFQVVEGSYQYYENGQLYSIQYKADAGGFQPTGAHLPQPPPIPPEIQKSLELIYRTAGQTRPNLRRQ